MKKYANLDWPKLKAIQTICQSGTTSMDKVNQIMAIVNTALEGTREEDIHNALLKYKGNLSSVEAECGLSWYELSNTMYRKMYVGAGGYKEVISNLEEKLIKAKGVVAAVSRLERVSADRVKAQIKKEKIDINKIRAAAGTGKKNNKKVGKRDKLGKLKWSTSWRNLSIDQLS